jgi:hypothetical protein
MMPLLYGLGLHLSIIKLAIRLPLRLLTQVVHMVKGQICNHGLHLSFPFSAFNLSGEPFHILDSALVYKRSEYMTFRYLSQ